MKTSRKTAIIFGALAVAWAGVLFFFSGQNGVDSSSLSLRLARVMVRWFPALGGPADFHPVLRKIAHFGIFAVEGFFAGVSLICALGCIRGMALSLGACALIAVANEIHQLFSDGRACEVRDMLIDTSGAALGVIAAAAAVALAVRIAKRKTPRVSG